MCKNNAESKPATPPKKIPRFLKKWYVQTGFFLLIFFFLFWGGSLRISPETTHITEPLTADGTRVDYFRAIEQEIYPPNMKTDANGYRMVVCALGAGIDPASPDMPLLTKQVYEKLGLDPTVKPTMTYESPYDFLKRYAEELLLAKDADAEPISDEDEELKNKLYDKTLHPWTLETLPMMADWLEQNELALDLVSKALKQPEFCAPLVRKDDKELLINRNENAVQRLGALARGLTARANYRIATGDLDGAIEDIFACKLLGRRVGQKGVAFYYGPGIENIADRMGIAGSLEHPPTEAQLQRLLNATIAVLNPIDDTTEKNQCGSIEQLLRYERFTNLETFQSWATFGFLDFDAMSSPMSRSDELAHKIGTHAIDWNVVMRRTNMYYDDPAKLKDLKDNFHVRTKPSWRILGVFLPSARSRFLADLFISMTSNIEIAEKTLHRTECADRIKAITLAMLIYEKQHGRLPPAYTIDANDKPLHSWRVLLLPHLGIEKAKKLYQKIKLDEPWDSEHNRQFHDVMLQVYRCPSAKLEPGETTYSVVVGKKTAFQAGEGKKLDQFGPNQANLILVIENHSPGCWMDPTSDLTEENAHEAFNNAVHADTLTIGLRSGSVTTLSKRLSDERFQQLLDGTAKIVTE